MSRFYRNVSYKVTKVSLQKYNSVFMNTKYRGKLNNGKVGRRGHSSLQEYLVK